MPDFVKHGNGDIDWTKMFMGIATAVIMVMQAYSQMQHNTTREYVMKMDDKIVPRTEIENTYMQGKHLVSRAELEKKIEEMQTEIDMLAGEK